MNITCTCTIDDSLAGKKCQLCKAAPDLLEALVLIMDGFEKGVFVRDVMRDHEASWAIRLIPFMAALGKAHAAIATAKDQN